MTTKKGILNAYLTNAEETQRMVRKYDVLSTDNVVFVTLTQNYNEEKENGIWVAPTPPETISGNEADVYIGASVTDNGFLDKLSGWFSDDYTASHEWIVPMAEVPDQGSSAPAPIAIAENSNLDALTAPGDYYRAASVAVTNAPSAIGTAPFALEVISTGGSNFIQRVTRGAGTPAVYQRVCYNGTFGNWATL